MLPREDNFSEKVFEKNSNRKPVRDFKIRIWTQIEISKLGSGASSSLTVSEGQLLTRLVARRVCKRTLLKTALIAKLTKRGGAKSQNHTPELKIIKLLKRRGGEVFFTTSVERVRVKPKTTYTLSVGKFLKKS